MKYSIRGNLSTSDESNIVSLLNRYILWRLVTKTTKDENDQDIFTFEVWVNTIDDKDSLFNALKPFVATSDEVIDWHECTHDEAISLPCVIAETYRGE